MSWGKTGSPKISVTRERDFNKRREKNNMNCGNLVREGGRDYKTKV